MSKYSFVHFNYFNEFIEAEFPSFLDNNSHAEEIKNIVIRSFQKDVSEDDISKELGITKRWLQKILKNNLGITFKRLLRILRIYAALKLLCETNLDNYDIALKLNYTEESNMARDFRKELHICPAEARKRLALMKPKYLFDELWKR